MYIKIAQCASSIYFCSMQTVLFGIFFLKSCSTFFQRNSIHELLPRRVEGSPTRKGSFIWEDSSYSFRENAQRCTAKILSFCFHTFLTIPCFWTTTLFSDKMKSKLVASICSSKYIGPIDSLCFTYLLTI